MMKRIDVRYSSKNGVEADPNEVSKRFWEAHPDALFTRREVAIVRRCSVALLEREAWAGTGIPVIRDGARCLHRKRDVLSRLGLAAE
jgi:hypothetical protein